MSKINNDCREIYGTIYTEKMINKYFGPNLDEYSKLCLMNPVYRLKGVLNHITDRSIDMDVIGLTVIDDKYAEWLELNNGVDSVDSRIIYASSVSDEDRASLWHDNNMGRGVEVMAIPITCYDMEGSVPSGDIRLDDDTQALLQENMALNMNTDKEDIAVYPTIVRGSIVDRDKAKILNYCMNQLNGIDQVDIYHGLCVQTGKSTVCQKFLIVARQKNVSYKVSVEELYAEMSEQLMNYKYSDEVRDSLKEIISTDFAIADFAIELEEINGYMDCVAMDER